MCVLLHVPDKASASVTARAHTPVSPNTTMRGEVYAPASVRMWNNASAPASVNDSMHIGANLHIIASAKVLSRAKVKAKVEVRTKIEARTNAADKTKVEARGRVDVLLF